MVGPGGSALAVLWDMDGVLVDSALYHFRAWRETLAAEGVDLDEDSFRRTFGLRNDAIIADLLGPGVPPERVYAIGAAKEERYRALVREEGMAPLPGTIPWLRRLHERGIPQAVVSSAPLANITTVLAAIAAADLFQAIVCGDDVARGKPDPASYLLAARRLGVPPERCVVVEDAPAGLEAARRAGMRSLAVATSRPRAELHADLVVDSLADLTEAAWSRLINTRHGMSAPRP